MIIFFSFMAMCSPFLSSIRIFVFLKLFSLWLRLSYSLIGSCGNSLDLWMSSEICHMRIALRAVLIFYQKKLSIFPSCGKNHYI